MNTPTATYRIQFSPSFGFEAAQPVISYLADLGISDLYASPIFKVVKGSLHGYDVADPIQEGDFPLGTQVWQDTEVLMPDGAPAAWRNAITGEVLSADKALSVGDILLNFPVALLIGEAKEEREGMRALRPLRSMEDENEFCILEEWDTRKNLNSHLKLGKNETQRMEELL